MRLSFRKVSVWLALFAVLFSVSACSSNTTEKPTHKAKTSVCLMVDEQLVPGSPNKELAANLVEAQIVYGVRARVVTIRTNSSVSLSLLKSLQSGCVLMVSAEPRLLEDLKAFAREHSKMMVLFFGEALDATEQPGNFRWVKDDLSSAALLAGFFAAQQGNPIRIYTQSTFYKYDELAKKITEGARAFSATGGNVSIETIQIATQTDLVRNLKPLVQPSTIVLLTAPTFANTAANFQQHSFVTADVQFGQRVKPLPENVLASIERGSSTQLLKAVAALLERQFSVDPVVRVEKPLGDGLVELRTLVDPSAELSSYRQTLSEQER